MRVLIALDWSEEAFAGVREVTYLYALREVILVHGIDLGMFQNPLVADMSNLQGYGEFRTAMAQAGRQLLDHTTTLLPSENLSITRVCEFAKPASLILDTARESGAELIVMGARGRGRVGELVLGSVSHRVAMHAPCSTLIVKDREGPVKKGGGRGRGPGGWSAHQGLAPCPSFQTSRSSHHRQRGAGDPHHRSVQHLPGSRLNRRRPGGS